MNVIVAQQDRWLLWHRTDKTRGEWHSFKLERLGPQKRYEKSNWWVGHNGQRLARNRDAGFLRQHEPETYAWVEHACSQLLHP